VRQKGSIVWPLVSPWRSFSVRPQVRVSESCAKGAKAPNDEVPNDGVMTNDTAVMMMSFIHLKAVVKGVN
jgi:hypothetical protein